MVPGYASLRQNLLNLAPSNDPQDDDSMSSWCGWHTGHGSLIGLTYAIYTKSGIKYLALILQLENEIAYQIGNITEILSRGRVCATLHCVRAPKGEKATGLERSTFALFMQPD
ncbi:putative 2-oxoglutarate and Fe(II)-dependent oxygenase superfamily protein, partial [Tanacetum coccineum]